MGFLFSKSKKNLDITDAILRKEAQITIGGKSVVIRAFTLAKALMLIENLRVAGDVFKMASTDFVAFRKFLLSQLPTILEFCEIKEVKPEEITLAEFADLLLAIYCVNDLERIITNFMTAVQSIPLPTQVLAVSPKH